ncbi:MAG: IPT/TIG domain-containing protein [Planctomycetes bacterium]|nr:IPT/TIG domain-containing protein [Planctomycetota bacterium]
MKMPLLSTLLFATACLLAARSTEAQTVTFDFDTGTPPLVPTMGLPVTQTAGGITAHFSGNFSVQSDSTTFYHMSLFSANYLDPSTIYGEPLHIQLDHAVSSIAFTYATADFGQVEIPTTIQAAAYDGSTPVGTATSHGCYCGDTMPMGTLSFTSVVPFNHVDITIPYAPLAACCFLIDNVTVNTAGVVVSSILPATGSEAGGERVTIQGSGFGTITDTSVTFGGVAAALQSVTSTLIRLTTPPGTSVVDVQVTTPGGAATMSSAYTYVAPYLAARFGHVRQGIGDREDVLLVNGTPGGFSREVPVTRGSYFAISMIQPTSPTNAPFCLYGWVGPVPSNSHVTMQPHGLGAMVFPTPFNPTASPQPRAIWNNLGYGPILGHATHASTPAPSVVLATTHTFSRPLNVTLQGFIRDDGSQIPQGASVTNAVVLLLQ